MDKGPKKVTPPKADTGKIRNLVVTNSATNERKVRLNVQSSPKQHTTDQSRPATAPLPLLDCIQSTTFNSKAHDKSFPQRRRKPRPNQRISEADETDKANHSPRKNDNGRSTIDIREPTVEHLAALRLAADVVLKERLISDQVIQQRLTVLTKFQQCITDARPGCQIQLYGSYLFKCCLERKTSYVDIDVQFKETLQYDTLKELLDIVTKSDMCKEAVIDPEHKPACINLILNEANMGVRITSGYTRGFHLSNLIRIYTEIDPRLIQLLRLCRHFAKVCDIDKPEIGTLHPVVFHLMIIHFLQQLDQPVLPCLHEYAYGVDHVPVTLMDNQYGDFFRVCQDYSRVWKSKNVTSVELLFLQFLSYYVQTFNSKQFVVSIQTRMPVVKSDKNWHSRKLLVEDPTDVKRSLCQTMQSSRSLDYFRDVFTAALNYFARQQKPRKPKVDATEEDFIEIVTDEPKSEPKHSLHNSYRLFYKRLPASVAREMTIKQIRVRDHYKQTFDEKDNPLPQGVLRLDSSNDTLADFVAEEIREALQHDEETNFETTDANEEQIPTMDEEIETVSRELFPGEEPTTPKEEEEEQQQQQPVIESPPTPEENGKTEETPIEYFYDFQPENFHAEQGAPYVCLTCNGVGHLKSECPELIVPQMNALPKLSDEWAKILTVVCQQITERFKPNETDISNREKILEQLRRQFQKDCPDCHLSAFGSFYNGFGFRQSDLDVCFVFKDQREQKNEEIVRILKKLLQSMRSSNIFDNVQPVLHAKVPIIRSRHRNFHIDIDISLHNTLAIENTRLLKTYTDIDSRVSELGYMIKHLAKFCDIGDASRGTISSYAYIIMLIHFLQQVEPPVLPVLQKLSDPANPTPSTFKKCAQWNVYFYDDLTKITSLFPKANQLSTGALWIEFLRFYTEQFNYDEHIVSIRQKEPLLRQDKGWFRRTIAIEDPFELTHNLAGGLNMRNWTVIRRVLIKARQQFAVQPKEINIAQPDMKQIEENLFDIDILCPQNAPRRCAWCQGPYHIRKRCPKLAQLQNEQEKQKRMQMNKARPYPPMQGYPAYDNPAPYPYHAYQQYPPMYPQAMIVQTFADGTRTFYNRSQPAQPNDYFQPGYHQQRQCFSCGGLDHIKANCPNKRSNPTDQRQRHGH